LLTLWPFTQKFLYPLYGLFQFLRRIQLELELLVFHLVPKQLNPVQLGTIKGQEIKLHPFFFQEVPIRFEFLSRVNGGIAQDHDQGGLLILSSMAIKNAKNHNPLTLCHNFAMTNLPDDSKAPITFSRCPRFAVTAWIAPLWVQTGQFGAKPALSTCVSSIAPACVWAMKVSMSRWACARCSEIALFYVARRFHTYPIRFNSLRKVPALMSTP